MVIAALLTLVAADPATAEPAGVAPTAVPADRIHDAPPARPDPQASYVFYLHGRIVEQQGANAVSPEFGRYEYRAILEALASAGHHVISELRPAATAVPGYASKVTKQIRALLVAGVPATSITVIGASKGGVIALRVSRALSTPGVGYVLLGACSERSVSRNLHGDVLSIFERSDPIGRSCGPSFAASPALGKHRELELQTGLKHGFMYRPIADWLAPALAWADAKTRAH